MNILKLEKELSLYLKDWIDYRWEVWSLFYHELNLSKRQVLYPLKYGYQLMDLVDNITGNIEEHLLLPENKLLIPCKFSSLQQLLSSLDRFNKIIQKDLPKVEYSLREENVPQEIYTIALMCKDIDYMVERCINVYIQKSSFPPLYRQAINCLINQDIKEFIEYLKSIIKSVPYNIHKEKINESYFHTIFHVITSVLGLQPISELETSDGRIDTVIEVPSCIYIFEFKYSDTEENVSKKAFDQIVDKDYSLSFLSKCKKIIGIGVSYSAITRNINGCYDYILHNSTI